MFEAHPFLTLLGCITILLIVAKYTDMEEAGLGVLSVIIFLVWGAWALKIPDTPEEIAEAKAKAEQREAVRREKETPKPLSEADGCTVYVFERQGREHFFTRCPASTSTETNWTEGCGKGCSRPMRDSIVTPNTGIKNGQ